ncbi:hypothetical protein [Wenxinia marina]|uniref:Uncharacterized protein n=1 Tax=Wenxinia marina DSM 24838 TaxID=1123501 RepID=A0A0D0PYD3_9RHOB|nr:hypothetical protein [Wenxinia marina]KIQ67439.1 hypothetical protein Wenmar_03862 [Wenxinia marina DSM 24838]GGL69509.1 hypothetical protein GCM10011392_24970 [Wenxinia marina]
MTRFLPLALVALLAGCAGGIQDTLNGIFPPEEPAEPPPPPPLPPQVVAALPPGAPQTTVIKNADGCYLFTVEATVPPSGYLIRDAAGNPICDGAPPTSDMLAGEPLAAPLQ